MKIQELLPRSVRLPLGQIGRVLRVLPPLPPASEPTQPTRDWNRPYDTLRAKWVELPFAGHRLMTAEALTLSDKDLMALWNEHRAIRGAWDVNGWYQELYRDTMRGKKIMDVGCGLGLDCIHFAQHGARVTFIDLASTNIALVRRVCALLGIDAEFLVLQELDSLTPLATDYDVILGIGSLHHAPQSVMKPECAELLRHLKPGGRWLQLTYPKARWEREGAPDFSRWGQMTDGDNTPFAEWYDVPKLLDLLAPARFEVVFSYEWHNQDYNWFDFKFLG